MHFFSFRDSPPILYKASEGSEGSEIFEISSAIKKEDDFFKQIKYLTFSFNVVLCVYDRIIRKIRNL